MLSSEKLPAIKIFTPVMIRLKFFFFFLVFLRPHLQPMELPKLGVELELQLPAYTTVTALWDLGHL